jgi:type IV fimbrial biogenesis protein FimT
MKAPNPSPRSQRGFNLIELMIAVVILAVLLGIGIPSLSEMVRTNRLAGQVNEFVSALTLARSEASKRGIRLSFCPANTTQDQCDGTNWATGWILFTDENTVGTVDGTDQIVQAWLPSAEGFTFNPAPATVSFLPSRADAPATFDIYRIDCTGEEKRRIAIDRVGRISLSKQPC